MAGESKPKARKAEAAAGPVSSKKAKVTPKATEPKGKKPAGGKAAAMKPKTISSAAPLDNLENAPFAWKACANDKDAFKRLEIKEEAVRQGLRQAGRVKSLLDSMNLAVSEADGLRNWSSQLDTIKTQHAEFRVFIGFAGVTGAGKTSIINSIIGYQDLLPSSNEAAATAVPCLIAYNDDPNPEAKFKAKITFRTEEDIRQMLDRYFDARKVFDEVSNGMEPLDSDQDDAPQPDKTGSSASDAQALPSMDHLKDLDIIEEDSQDLLDMVSAVFGLDEAELKAESTESLLAKHPDVLNLLGQTISVAGSNVDEFSDTIKPYMDSVAAVHGPSGVKFEAWPLINEVEIFVDAPVLKSGIVLVDLPGLADNIESRASVAQNYFSKLSVTAIVAPIIRARNEQTAVNLMTENQQYCMQMDGKFHKKSFCVILSKIDDINVDTYLKQHSVEAKSNQDLQRCRASLDTLNQEFKEMEKEKSNQKQLLKTNKQQCDKLQAEHEKAMAEGNRDTKAEELEECKEKLVDAQDQIFSLHRRLEQNRKQAKHLSGRIFHWCVHGRNSLVKKEIELDFQRRQKRLGMAARRQDLYDGTVKVFPVSSAAYWKTTKDNEAPVGFPSPEYTGIPALQYWLGYAAIPDREKHLDVILNALHGLFNTMQTWSSTQFQGQLALSKQFVMDEVLYRPLQKIEKTLKPAFGKLCRDIKALNPMKNQDSTVANCKAKCIGVVQRWSNREPDNLLCKTKMHWNTYSACVTRHGGVFRARNQGRYRYAWIESLCNLFYEGIVKDWNLALNEEVPALRAPTNEKIDELWAQVMKQLEQRVRIAAPQMQQLFDREKDSLEQIKEQLKDMVGKQFDHISVGASKAHRTIFKSVQGKFEPAFKKAKKERGKGRFRKQQGHLEQHAKMRGANMFRQSSAGIVSRLGEQLASLTKEFNGITVEIQTRVRDLILLMLDGTTVTLDDAAETKTAPSSKQEVQRATQQIISEWAVQWRIANYAGISLNALDKAIPEVYYDEAEEGDDSDSSGLDGLNDESYKEFLRRQREEGDFD